jgi:hypothetical protein
MMQMLRGTNVEGLVSHLSLKEIKILSAEQGKNFQR